MERWQQEYLDLMFGVNRSVETMEQAAVIKYMHMPQSLFKYRAANERTIDALKNNCLFSAEPSTFNDVDEVPIKIQTETIKELKLQTRYDALRNLHSELPKLHVRTMADMLEAYEKTYGYSCDESKLIGFVISSLEKISDGFLEGIQKTERNRYNLICFSSNGDNDLMWAHYADGHRGFCIEYDFKSLGIQHQLVQLSFPVVYDDNIEVLISDLNELNANIGMYAATIKKSDWKYEEEWRTFFLHSDKPKAEILPLPKAIHLGKRTSIEIETEIKNICTEKGIQVFKI